MRPVLALVTALSLTIPAAAHDLSYYLPDGQNYDPAIATPASVLGFEVGEWHVRHDLLERYYRTVAEQSPRMELFEYGRTHESRTLMLAAVSSPANLARLEELRTEHLAGLEDPSRDGGPLVIWMGYSVHGNESSGSNAAPLTAYHLTASRSEEVRSLLDDAIVLIDPCINPDGLSRFAQWANQHRGYQLVGNPDHREHREVWPGGRTNHYWFDLNRDWLLLTHPESRGRLVEFHRWKPHVLTDFHEMGSNSTYFFQPGVPSRQNPHTPDANLDLTRRIAEYHARILDEIGSLYYSEEGFDDFYYGKGSTYPDVNGCIGILFEQASSRGHLQDNSFGELTFPFTIRNQFRTTLSTLTASHEMKDTLIEYQRRFYQDASEVAARDPVGAYVFGHSHDRARVFHFVDILRRHQIEVAELATTVETEDGTFETGASCIVPLDQPQARLVKALFERPTEFRDNTFYDVSTWTLPLAFGIPFGAVPADSYSTDLIGERLDRPTLSPGRMPTGDDAYAYLLEWNGYYAPRAAARLLDAGVRVRVATRPFRIATDAGERDFTYGTLLVALGIQDVSADEVRGILNEIASQDAVDVYAVETGLTPEGIDLGSPSVRDVQPVRPLLVVGSGVSSYEAGEVWHLLDVRYEMGLVLAEASRMDSVNLDEITHVILVNGAGSELGSRTTERLKDWVRAGGVLVAQKSSVSFARREILGREDDDSSPADRPSRSSASAEDGDAADDTSAEDADAPPERPAYADYESMRAETLVSGTIFEAHIDVTHPLGYGYRRPTIPVFRNSTRILAVDENPFATVVQYTDDPLQSGFVSAKNLDKIAGSAVVNANRHGRGVVIQMVDNPNFRGFWYGTNKLLANALFFGGVIKSTSNLWDDEGASGRRTAEELEHGHKH